MIRLGSNSIFSPSGRRFNNLHRNRYGYSDEGASSLLLHHRRLLFADAGQSLLNPAREFFLPVKLDLRVFLGHPDRAWPGVFQVSDLAPADLLPPRDIRAPEGVRAETWEIATLGRRRPL